MGVKDRALKLHPASEKMWFFRKVTVAKILKCVARSSDFFFFFFFFTITL